jgi:hypothetical protein
MIGLAVGNTTNKSRVQDEAPSYVHSMPQEHNTRALLWHLPMDPTIDPALQEACATVDVDSSRIPLCDDSSELST